MEKLLFAACLAGILPAFAVSPTYVVSAGTPSFASATPG